MKRPRFTAEALKILQEYDWAGNVRELENMCERICVLEAGREVSASSVTPFLHGPIKTASAKAQGLQYRDGQILHDAERDLIVRTLERFGGHREKTARALGIGLRTLGLKLKKWREEGTFQEERSRRRSLVPVEV